MKPTAWQFIPLQQIAHWTCLSPQTLKASSMPQPCHCHGHTPLKPQVPRTRPCSLKKPLPMVDYQELSTVSAKKVIQKWLLRPTLPTFPIALCCCSLWHWQWGFCWKTKTTSNLQCLLLWRLLKTWWQTPFAPTCRRSWADTEPSANPYDRKPAAFVSPAPLNTVSGSVLRHPGTGL